MKFTNLLLFIKVILSLLLSFKSYIKKILITCKFNDLFLKILVKCYEVLYITLHCQYNENVLNAEKIVN